MYLSAPLYLRTLWRYTNAVIIVIIKSLEKSLITVMLTWKMQMSVTLLITDAFVNFFAVHVTKHLKFKVKKFESCSIFRIEEYIV